MPKGAVRRQFGMTGARGLTNSMHAFDKISFENGAMGFWSKYVARDEQRWKGPGNSRDGIGPSEATERGAAQSEWHSQVG